MEKATQDKSYSSYMCVEYAKNTENFWQNTKLSLYLNILQPFIATHGHHTLATTIHDPLVHTGSLMCVVGYTYPATCTHTQW